MSAPASRGRRLPIHPYLVRDAEERRALSTFCGMASFAGSGPPGATCSQCRFWLGKPKGAAAICLEYKRLMSGREGPKVPAGAASCKYFASRGEPK
jgi:hypothetical protein